MPACAEGGINQILGLLRLSIKNKAPQRQPAIDNATSRLYLTGFNEWKGEIRRVTEIPGDYRGLSVLLEDAKPGCLQYNSLIVVPVSGRVLSSLGLCWKQQEQAADDLLIT